MSTTLMLKLLGDNSSMKLRGMFAPDGLQVFSVFDFLTIACAKNDKGAYARKWFGDNVKDEGSPFHNEFVGQIQSFQFPGSFSPVYTHEFPCIRGPCHHLTTLF